jgi:uncharacterized protein (DUF342 family)
LHFLEIDMNLAGISLTETDGKIFLRGLPDSLRPPISASELLTYIEQAGLGDCRLLHDSIVAAVRDCNTRTSPFVTQVAERLDAAIEVQIAPDAMTAAVSLKPPQGGKAASIEDVIHALAQAGVIYGIDEAALLQACQTGIVENLPVASGKPPVNGVDASFESLVPQTVDRAPRLDADGLIDYREHGAITLVQAGSELMRRIPSTPGEEGTTILGHPLPPRAGIDYPFTAQLSGVAVAANDPNLLTAAVAGQPVRIPHGIMVEPVLQVAAVNLATGNISFDGTVQIEGDVIQDMKIQASGDIIVGGTVDGALLEATGNVVVNGGIIAKSTIRARGSVTARFAQDSTVFAGTVIALDDMAMHCRLQAINQIIVGKKAPQRGRLVGGSATAMMLISAPLLGSGKGDLTTIMVGDNPELEAKNKALRERIDNEKTNEENLQKLIRQLTAVGDPKGMLERVRVSWRQAVQVWGKSLAELKALEQDLAVTRSAKVKIGVAVEGPVDLAFAGKMTRLRKTFGPGEFSVNADADLLFTDPSGKSTPIAAG